MRIRNIGTQVDVHMQDCVPISDPYCEYMGKEAVSFSILTALQFWEKKSTLHVHSFILQICVCPVPSESPAKSGGEVTEKELILRNLEKSDTNRLCSLIEYEGQKSGSVQFHFRSLCFRSALIIYHAT